VLFCFGFRLIASPTADGRGQGPHRPARCAITPSWATRRSCWTAPGRCRAPVRRIVRGWGCWSSGSHVSLLQRRTRRTRPAAPHDLPLAATAALTRPGAGFSKRISGTVPGDLLTDLTAAGLIGDPLRELNFQDSLLWHNYTWTYSTLLNVSAQAAAGTVLLVFDGARARGRQT
jgi:hypothetical protein